MSQTGRRNQHSGPDTLLVATADATVAQKATADWVCDGTADDVQINAALQALDPIVCAACGQKACADGLQHCEQYRTAAFVRRSEWEANR